MDKALTYDYGDIEIVLEDGWNNAVESLNNERKHHGGLKAKFYEKANVTDDMLKNIILDSLTQGGKRDMFIKTRFVVKHSSAVTKWDGLNNPSGTFAIKLDIDTYEGDDFNIIRRIFGKDHKFNLKKDFSKEVSGTYWEDETGPHFSIRAPQGPFRGRDVHLNPSNNLLDYSQ